MIGLYEILIFITGIVHGYTKPVEEDTGNLLEAGFIYGLILGAVIGILQSGILGVLADTFTFITLALIASIVFGLSTFMGHLLKKYLNRGR